MGERDVRNVEVEGSTPLLSTKSGSFEPLFLFLVVTVSQKRFSKEGKVFDGSVFSTIFFAFFFRDLFLQCLCLAFLPYSADRF